MNLKFFLTNGGLLINFDCLLNWLSKSILKLDWIVKQ